MSLWTLIFQWHTVKFSLKLYSLVCHQTIHDNFHTATKVSKVLTLAQKCQIALKAK